MKKKKRKKLTPVAVAEDGLPIYRDFAAIRAIGAMSQLFNALSLPEDLDAPGKVMYGFYEKTPETLEWIPDPDFFLVVDNRYENRLIAIKYMDKFREQLKDRPDEYQRIRDRTENEAFAVAANPKNIDRYHFYDLRMRGRRCESLSPKIYSWLVKSASVNAGSCHHLIPFDWHIFREMAMQFLASREEAIDPSKYPHVRICAFDDQCSFIDYDAGFDFSLNDEEVAAMRDYHGALAAPPFAIPEIEPTD